MSTTKKLIKRLSKDQIATTDNIKSIAAYIAANSNGVVTHNPTGEKADTTGWDKIKADAAASEAVEVKEKQVLYKARKNAAAAKEGIGKLKEDLRLTKKEFNFDIKNCKDDLKKLRSEIAELKNENKRLRKDVENIHTENKILRKIISEMFFSAFGVYIKKPSKLLRHIKRRTRNNNCFESIAQKQRKKLINHNNDTITIK